MMLRSKLFALASSASVQCQQSVRHSHLSKFIAPEQKEQKKAKRDMKKGRAEGHGYAYLKNSYNTESKINTIKDWKAGIEAEKQAKENVLMDISEVKAVEEAGPTLHWHNYDGRKRLGHGVHGPWLFLLPRRACWRFGRMSGTACPCCRAKWVPNYRDVHILKDYVDPISMTVLPIRVTQVCQVKQRMLKEAVRKAQSHGTMKPPPSKPIRSWGDKEVYGKHSSQIYGSSQVYHEAYRHLPGNIYYEKGNEYWGHHEVTTGPGDEDFIEYE